MGQPAKLEHPDFRILFESAPALYLVLTPDLNIVAVSDAYLRATMTTREQILGRGLFDVFPDNPDDPNASGARNLKASLDRVREQGAADIMAVQKYDIRRPESEGGGFEERFWSPVNSPVFGPSHEMEYIIHRVEDVTDFVRLKQRGSEQEKVTEELRSLAERMETEVSIRTEEVATFQLLFSRNPLPMWVYDVETLGFLEVNATAVVHYGYSREEFLRMRIVDIRPSSEVPRLTTTVQRMASETQDQTIRHAGTWQHRLKNGRIIDVEVISQSLTFAGRRAALVVAMDVTELKRTQQTLAKHAERLRILHEIDRALVAEEAPAAIAEAVLRPLRDLLGVPRAVVNMFDLAAGEVEWLAAVGRRRIHVGPGVRYSLQLMGDIEALRRGELQVIDVDALPPSAEAEALLASGVHLYMVVPMIAGGELIGALSFGGPAGPFPAEQVSIAQEAAMQLAIAIAQARLRERVKERTQQLLQSEKLATMGSLLAGVAHELNNPLAVVLGFAHLLRDGARELATQQRAGKILGAAERCARIVKNFLALARQHPPERGAVNLHEVLQEAVELLAYPLRIDTVRVTFCLADGLPALWADGHQLHQLLVNLIANAHQAMRGQARERQIVITTRRDPDRPTVLLEVTDTGPGIPRDIQQRIFDPFFTTKPPGEGTGLGLSLCRGIIEGHGGSIAVASEPGHGTTFRIELPLVTPPAAARDGTAESLPAIASQRILVVDDEAEIAAMVAEALQLDGHAVETAENGAAALIMLERADYDLVLTDTKMPIVTGEDFYRELARRFPALGQRIIFMTGDVMSPEKRAFLDATGAPWVSKPFTPQELRRLVHRVAAGLRPTHAPLKTRPRR
ncbi:MAG TPA: ATP-binding protein [Methylomirabilota bacterium]|jgi:PAS domain S-box-containing protein|nr:ATP-binding protein [Methylomirabilota bacterium]